MAFNILFVCTGNTCRSPTAEGILKNLLAKKKRERFTISSAGIAGLRNLSASKNAIEVMKEMDIDISTHISRPIEKALMDKADLILVFSESHRTHIKQYFPEVLGKTFLLSEYADKGNPPKNIPDPMGGDIDTYRNTRNEIHKYMLMIVEKMNK